jgi:ferritin-like metal-binding protein YciE
MPAPENFFEIYTDELKDLWSANDQMNRVLKKLTSKAKGPKLKEMLLHSQKGIAKHTNVLKELIADAGGKPKALR